MRLPPAFPCFPRRRPWPAGGLAGSGDTLRRLAGRARRGQAALGIVLWLATGPGLVALASPRPEPVDPATRPAFSPPGQPGLRARWVIGADATEGPYLLQVQLQPGVRLPPHRHPDDRVSTVLQGTLWVGFGEAFDPQAAVAVPAGSSVLAPAGQAHWVWARDGEVVYQEQGRGPTATRFLAPPAAAASAAASRDPAPPRDDAGR